MSVRETSLDACAEIWRRSALPDSAVRFEVQVVEGSLLDAELVVRDAWGNERRIYPLDEADR